ncbi:MAG: LuxR C-terminal-related transcriptional regulator [Planctomycetota bacterium]
MGDIKAVAKQLLIEHDLRLDLAYARLLHLFLTGMTETEIADAAYLSPHTIHAYGKQIRQAFGVSSRTELLALALKVAIRMQPPTAAQPEHVRGVVL